MLKGVVRYEWKGHAVWLSHELLLMKMEVHTFCYFVSVNNIQTGAVGDSEANFFPNFKDGSFVTSSSVHVTTLGSFGSKANLFNP